MDLYLGFRQHIVSVDHETTSQALAAGQGSTLVLCLVLIGVFFNNICLALCLAHVALRVPTRGNCASTALLLGSLGHLPPSTGGF